MASKSEDGVKRPRARIKEGSKLDKAWQDWETRFETKADAVTTAMEAGLTETDLEELERQANPGLSMPQVAVIALSAAAIGSLVAQAMLVFGVVVASGLTALALLVVGGLMYAYEG